MNQAREQAMRQRLIERLQEEEFLRQQLTVTEHDYGQAVERLLSVALSDTSGGRAAAQVLLSTYNGHNYHMDLTELCVLDPLDLVNAALIVLRGRTLLGEEPQNVIKDGSARFLALEHAWPGLHIKNRYEPYEPSF